MSSFITILGRKLPLYGIFFYIGILVAAGAAVLLGKKRRIATFDIVGSAVYVMIGAIFGAKLLFIAVSWQEIIEYGVSLVGVIKGGFVFYGGLVGGAIGLCVYLKQFKMRTLDLIDLYATVLPLGHAFGRVGCFFAGCCYGIPYDGIFSHVYSSSVGTTPIGVPLLAIQLVEAFLLLCLFTLLLCVYLRHKKHSGICSVIYAASYAILRFFLEFFRGDSERGRFLLSTSQWISIGILAMLLIIILQQNADRRKDTHAKR